MGDPPEHIDPALNSTLDAYQAINAMYDGLTDIDSDRPGDPRSCRTSPSRSRPTTTPSVWTFTIRDGQTFAGGEEILPSTFAELVGARRRPGR